MNGWNCDHIVTREKYKKNSICVWISDQLSKYIKLTERVKSHVSRLNLQTQLCDKKLEGCQASRHGHFITASFLCPRSDTQKSLSSDWTCIFIYSVCLHSLFDTLHSMEQKSIHLRSGWRAFIFCGQ